MSFLLLNENIIRKEHVTRKGMMAMIKSLIVNATLVLALALPATACTADQPTVSPVPALSVNANSATDQIGRASCRERV